MINFVVQIQLVKMQTILNNFSFQINFKIVRLNNFLHILISSFIKILKLVFVILFNKGVKLELGHKLRIRKNANNLIGI